MDIVGFIQQNAPPEARLDQDYLKRLYSMPPTLLNQEKKTLGASHDAMLESTQQLGASHVDSFTKTHQSIDRLELLARRLDQSAGEAQEGTLSTPRLPERSFRAIETLISNDLVLYENVDRVQELLSLPELVRDRVLDGEYAQALELAGMTKKLHLRYPKSGLVAQLNSDVQVSVESMRTTLLRSLREASKLSLLTKAVTYLREMHSLDLESVFIESRWYFLENEQWGAIPPQLKRTQPFAYLKRFVDIYREHVFATINGFRVIFKHKPSNKEEDSEVGGTAGGAEGLENPLARFARKALVRLLGELREHAPLITNKTERSSLWLQLAFCSRSMGRVGADFWRLLDSDVLSEEEWKEASQNQQDTARRASKYSK